MKSVITTIVLIVALCPAPLYAQQTPNLTGDWKGYINLPNQKLTIELHFKNTNVGSHGTVDIPQQGGKGLKLQNIKQTNTNSVSWIMDTGGNGTAKFEGHFETDSVIAGTFHQRGYQFPFKASRYTPKVANQKPLSYHHEDIIINKNDSIKIGGTLTWPQKGKTNQLVIMISGSGAQNRDENIFGFKIFEQIADYLMRRGIATYRYDDRGAGESTGNFRQAGLQKLASDVEASVAYFSDDSHRHFSDIILFGHSQGGYVGTKVAVQDTLVDNLILMSSPGVTLAKIVIAQAGGAKIEKAIMDTLHGSQNFTQLEDSMVERDLKKYNQKPDSNRRQLKNPRKFFWKKEQRVLKAMESPSYFSFLDYDPTNDLSKLHIPVLALFGGKDQQVPIRLNREPIQSALDSAGVCYQINVFKNANHLYQKAKTGDFRNYGKLPHKFVKGFLPTIAQWIQRKETEK